MLPTFPLMYLSSGEAKAGGVLLLVFVAMAVMAWRERGRRLQRAARIVIEMLATAFVVSVIYFCTSGPAWLLFPAAVVAGTLTVINLQVSFRFLRLAWWQRRLRIPMRTYQIETF